jgi:hypothetical protein
VGRDLRSKAGQRFGEGQRADHFDREDFERFGRLLPFQNVVGFRNLLNYAASRVPREGDR